MKSAARDCRVPRVDLVFSPEPGDETSASTCAVAMRSGTLSTRVTTSGVSWRSTEYAIDYIRPSMIFGKFRNENLFQRFRKEILSLAMAA